MKISPPWCGRTKTLRGKQIDLTTKLSHYGAVQKEFIRIAHVLVYPKDAYLVWFDSTQL